MAINFFLIGEQGKVWPVVGGGPHSTEDSFLASRPVAPGLILRVPEKNR